MRRPVGGWWLVVSGSDGRTSMRTSSRLVFALVCALLLPALATAEVTKVTIASRAVVANGQPFGSVGPYEKLTGTIEFALDPANPHNKPIADLGTAPRGNDGRVHFSADLH